MRGGVHGFARPLPGDGLVAQEGSLSLVCAAPDAVTAPLVDALLTALEEVAEADGDGTALVGRVAGLLAARRGLRPHACAVAGPSGESGLAVLVSGDAGARVMLAGGAEVRLGGAPGGTEERTVQGPVASLELALGTAGRAEPRLRLTSGVVRGGGLRRSLRRPARASVRPVRPAAGSAAQAAVRAAGKPSVQEPARPAPKVAPPPTAIEPAPEPVSLIRKHPRRATGPRVLGVNCKNEHFNDPRAHYCAVCGISMLQLTLSPFHGPRPPLGVLLLDDGHTIPLDHDQLVGRVAEKAPEVAAGKARPLRLTDEEASVSRRHALVRLDEWQVSVVDLGSANGTAVRDPGTEEFRRLPPETAVELRPGATVRIGLSRTFRFESNRKV
ncbi:FHA domain-containing protein [Actinomadura sp. NEAU-AAG5]|uniref:FHA domain-containing protein n=1 Tax=Actinomadura litoris TaxID=2678616 RepID=A0A7K1KZN1_9ACTN|nr:FHA domain-containing protein [Actinomadura litoris]